MKKATNFHFHYTTNRAKKIISNSHFDKKNRKTIPWQIHLLTGIKFKVKINKGKIQIIIKMSRKVLATKKQELKT